MAKIGLYDCDKKTAGKCPNLVLMKLSAWHKAIGDTVEWWTPFDQYDRVYVSRVFSFSSDAPIMSNAKEVIKGGSGYCIRLVNGREVYLKERDVQLPYEIEHTCPDTSIYGITDTAYGYSTRGCPRGCKFCIVATKEGRCSKWVADISEFWHGEKNIVLFDPNILACTKHRMRILRDLAATGAWVDFNQGLDARLLTPAICEALTKIKIKQIHFAWDRYEDGKYILPKLEMFARYNFSGKNSEHNAIVYVLVNFDTTFEQDLERVYKLRELGYWAYIMTYDKKHADKKYKRLARWVNNRFIFHVCKRYEDYDDRMENKTKALKSEQDRQQKSLF